MQNYRFSNRGKIMKTVIEVKANIVDNSEISEIDKRLRYFFKNKGYGIRWKDGICLITKTGIRGRRCFKVLCNGKDYRIEAFYKAFFQPGFIYNKSLENDVADLKQHLREVGECVTVDEKKETATEYRVKVYYLPQDTTLYAYVSILLAIIALFIPLCVPVDVAMILVFGIALISIGFGTQGRKCPLGVTAALSMILPYAVLIFYGGSYIIFFVMYGMGKLWWI